MDHNWLEIQIQGERKRVRFREEARGRRLRRGFHESHGFLPTAPLAFWRGLSPLEKNLGTGTSIDRAGSHQSARRSGTAHAS